MPYSVKLLLPQFLINLMQEHTQNTVLDVIITQQQAEKVLILGKALNQCIIGIVIETELEVLVLFLAEVFNFSECSSKSLICSITFVIALLS